MQTNYLESFIPHVFLIIDYLINVSPIKLVPPLHPMSLSFCLFQGSVLVSSPGNFPSSFFMLLFLSNKTVGTLGAGVGLFFFITSNLQYDSQGQGCSRSSLIGTFHIVTFINCPDLEERKTSSMANSQDKVHPSYRSRHLIH